MVKYMEIVRADQKWEDIWTSAWQVYEKKTSSLDCADQHPWSERPDKKHEKEWARQLYFPVLNTIMDECSERFPAHAMFRN